MNKFIGIGNLGDVPERIVGGYKLSLCTQVWDGQENKDVWVKILVLDDEHDNCLKSLTKGSRVSVEGRLDTSKTGQTIVITDRVEFL